MSLKYLSCGLLLASILVSAGTLQGNLWDLWGFGTILISAALAAWTISREEKDA